MDFVGIYTGAKMDKFEKCSLTKQRSQHVAPPTIAECPVALECRVSEVIPMGTHDVFIADILGVSCHESLFDQEGKLHFERANLLAYAHCEYYSLGEIVGRFGFSTDKVKKAVNKPEKTKETAEKDANKPEKAEKSTEKKDKKPFYENLPHKRLPKRKISDKNKGAPHSRKRAPK